jgi:ribosomal protein S18 acetylase RimI-like enzyme
MTRIRPLVTADLDTLYRIALLTGDSGADASALHEDPRLIGHIYAAPYVMLTPQTAFVAEDADGVAGYIVGAVDTRAFEARLERDWWPALRIQYADPTGQRPETWTADQMRAWLIHHPYPTPDRVVRGHPSHLHINLLPRLQGQGMGRALMDTFMTRLRSLGSPGVHLGTSLANTRARRFYDIYGFSTVERPDSARSHTVWMQFRL